MQERLDHILFNEGFLKKTDRIMCAVSGGADSVVMTHLFNALGVPIIVAHCDFQLRGNESDQDAIFVESMCVDLGLPFHVKRFDTIGYSKQNNLSIQEAARALRYTWFESLRKEEKCDFIATAHNKTDNLETVLINQIRGTGLSGFTGISEKRDKIIRPILSFTSDEIRKYATQQNIRFRNDSSNASDKYLRNNLRHHILPKLIEIEPNIESIVLRNSTQMLEYDGLIEHVVADIKVRYITTKNDIIYIPISVVNSYPHPHLILYRLVSHSGLNYAQIHDLTQSTEVGTYIENADFKMSRDRTHYLLQKSVSINLSPISIDKCGVYSFADKKIRVQEIKGSDIELPMAQNACIIHRSVLETGIHVRTWSRADKIQPFGMSGSKLISDVLIDHKVPNLLKTYVPIFEVKEEIMWVGEYCFSEKFKMDLNSIQTSTIIQVTVSQK